MSLVLLISDISAGILGAFLFYLYLSTGRNIPLPPGPRKLPIIGNALDMPTKLPSESFAKMSKKYNSDIIHLNVLGTNIIVLNSFDKAQELLDRRSGIYSSRPKSIMLRELGGYNYTFVGTPYNSEWRTHRRIFTKYFHHTKTEINQPKEIEYVRILLEKLLESPEKFLSHIRHMVGAIAISMVYGLKIEPEDDPYIDMSEKALETINEMITPGAFFVETFPLLKWIPEWFPGAHFHKVARRSRNESDQVLHGPYNASISALDDGTIRPSFIYEGLLDMQSNGGSDSDVEKSQHIQTMKEVGVMTYLGAMDTTYASLSTFILIMMLYPEVQKAAQQELDKVIGDRLPNHDDIPSVPYMTALLWELLRWETPVSTGFFHTNTEEDIFEGYYIPKGSMIIPNQRAMLHDERDYVDPKVFKPERFLKEGRLNDAVKNPEDIAFGFGRRRCPGVHLAKSTLWLSMASILSTFEIAKQNEDGNVLKSSTYEFHTAGVRHPKPFACAITPRSKHAVSRIRSVSEQWCSTYTKFIKNIGQRKYHVSL